MTTETFPPEVERWRALVADHAPASRVDDVLRAMWRESEYVPSEETAKGWDAWVARMAGYRKGR